MKKGNGLFGSAEQTGSIGVVTLNMARLGYMFKNDKENLYKTIKDICSVAKDALEVKRKFLTERLEAGFYPFTKRWIGTYRNFFSTIGVNGINEMIKNYTDGKEDITTEFGQDFAEDALNYIRDLMVDFQKETGHLYNLEATPAEGATTRFARADKNSIQILFKLVQRNLLTILTHLNYLLAILMISLLPWICKRSCRLNTRVVQFFIFICHRKYLQVVCVKRL